MNLECERIVYLLRCFYTEFKPHDKNDNKKESFKRVIVKGEKDKRVYKRNPVTLLWMIKKHFC